MATAGTVTVGFLPEGSCFKTALTRRDGTVLRRNVNGQVLVALDALKGSAFALRGGAVEQKCICPETLVLPSD